MQQEYGDCLLITSVSRLTAFNLMSFHSDIYDHMFAVISDRQAAD